jgi:hypothetical protein
MPENWYKLSPRLLNAKVSSSPLLFPLSSSYLSSIKKELRSIRARFNSSLPTMLIHLFPEIGLKKKKFTSLPSMQEGGEGRREGGRENSYSWWYIGNINEKKQIRRDILMAFAVRNSFDPLVPDNWYSVSLDSFLKKKPTVCFYLSPSPLSLPLIIFFHLFF